MVFMPPGMKPCKDKQEPEQLLKPVVFVSSELGEVIEKDDGAQPLMAIANICKSDKFDEHSLNHYIYIYMLKSIQH